MSELLNVVESQKLIEKYGIEFAKSIKILDLVDLENKTKNLKFPIAMKILSNEISHKSDIGGVKLNLDSIVEARNAFSELAELPGFQGVLIQEMLSGRELIIGGKQDAQFGPTILFGLGGIFVEVFKDFSLRICPIKEKDAIEMIKELKSYPILKGIRGQEGINFDLLKKYLLQVSYLMMHENIQELDLNPLIAFGQTIKAIDARIIKN